MTPQIPLLRRPKTWLAASGAYLGYAATCWIFSRLVGLTGGDAWVLRIALWLIGAVAGGIVLWFLAGRGAKGDATTAVSDELDAPLRAADGRLKQAGARNGLRGMPLLVIVGPEGSTKTSVVVNSGLEPELLAGEVYHGGGIGPTPTVNIWYSQKTLLLEMGGTLTNNASLWSRVVRRIRPRTLHATLTGRPQSPRAALVCFSCEEFLKPGSGEAIPAAARELRTLLLKLAQGFGVELPVYVLFTKADRIPHFPEYVQHLTREESQQVLGTTLRWPPRTTAGLYADREFQRLNTAFDRLIGALAGKRPDLLAREQDEGRRGSLYEFPRELRKLVPAAVQFLVDLCRPTQLSGNPMLRGVYFTGVRAVEVSDAMPSAPKPVSGSARVAATQAFDRAFLEGVAPSAAPSSSARRLPQWLFLGRFFRDVLLTDPAPRTVARSARQVGALRRASLAAAIAVAFVLGLGSTVAFVRNKGAIAAADALAAAEGTDGALASEPTLQRLEALRTHLERLSRWRRWGLYKGTSLYPSLRRAYHERFDRILLDPAQRSIVRSLDSLPATPTLNSQFGEAFNTLKAYLMTTSEPGRLESGFVVKELMESWLNGRQIDSAPNDLARAQFEFYADVLCHSEPCTRPAQQVTVAKTRRFLDTFQGAERQYEMIIAQAGRQQRPLSFARAYPMATSVMSARYEVPPAFTPDGWRFMQTALRNLDQYFGADDWVLGKPAAPPSNRVELERELRRRYVADYQRHWRALLATASVAPFNGLADASAKLQQLGGNQSPLLQLFGFVARNTNIDSQTVGAAFQPVHSVVPPTLENQVVSDASKGYTAALVGIRNVLEQSRAAPDAQGVSDKVMAAASNARNATGDLTSKFRSDEIAAQASGRVTALLEEPIVRVERLMARLPAGALNAEAANFCRWLNTLLAKFPFRSTGVDATLGDLREVFDPNSGALARFYNETLSKVLVRQGTQYRAKAGSAVSPAYVRFLNRLAGVNDALWPTGSPEPRLDFTIKINPPTGVDTVLFNMDGAQRRYTPTNKSFQQFRWSGSLAREVRVSAITRGGEEAALVHTGLWGLFKMLQRAQWQRLGESPTVLLTLTGPGKSLTVEAELYVGAASSLLKGDYFTGFTCLAQVSP